MNSSLLSKQKIRSGETVDSGECVTYRKRDLSGRVERHLFVYNSVQYLWVCGDASVYKHSQDPNLFYELRRAEVKKDEKTGRIYHQPQRLEFLATRDIGEGEELTINFNQSQQLRKNSDE